MFGRGYDGGYIERACDGLYRGHGAMFSMIWILLLIALTILVVYILFKNKNTNMDSDILEILKRKYINGEISEEEYIQKKSVLTNKKHL